ncbi:hypothetical protein BBAD15_g11923 [Beauveria bassiana D1-5]|uniref:Protein kinase domain-containing protein n=1 Tax=Beauveria bassiana D1-5 TaxID=1245745 RepID=A0A0A2V948_BEABA|nr:hypothetical protein BBAD15_g11923 [Beauveria bassiana D1-5]
MANRLQKYASSVTPLRALTALELGAKATNTLPHENLTTVHEIYRQHGSWHIVTEQAARSLQEAVGNPFMDSSMIAAIIGQIVTVLVYLESQGLRHESLTCSDILLHPTGRITLDRQWNCVYSDTKEDIRRLGCVMMELMDGYVKDGGSVGLDDPSRWSPEAVQFLGATTSVSSAKELLLHPFLASWQRAKLQGVISLTMAWTTQSHQYIGSETVAAPNLL